MDQGLRRTGYFFCAISALSAVMNVIQEIFQFHHTFPSFLLTSYVPLHAALAILFFLSVRFGSLSWIQPAIMFLYLPEPLFAVDQTFYSIGLFVTGMLLLFRIGFFDRYRVPKLAACFIYLYGWLLFSVLRSGRNIIYSIAPVVFTTLFLFLIFKERIAVYIREPKLKFSLSTHGLSSAERLYTMALSSGKSSKEIALDYELSESTVRNTLARSYKKLGIEDKADLAMLAERYEIVE